MRLTVRVKPHSRREGLEPQADGSLLVRVSAPPAEGRANEAVLRAVAEHFGVPRSKVRLVHGARGKTKLVEVDSAQGAAPAK